MTLRQRTLLIIGAAVAGLIVSLYSISAYLTLRQFAGLEEQHTREHVGRALDALSNDLAGLNTTVGDYAVWDESYAFVQDASPDYVTVNLPESVFVNLRLNVIVFADASGQLVFAKAFDLQSQAETPFPQSLRTHLSGDGPLLQHANVESSLTGMVLLPEGPLFVASQPILTSEGSGPIGGTLLMGRYLDEAEVTRLADITHLSLTLRRFDDPQLSADFQSARVGLASSDLPLVQALSADSVAGYTLLTDVYGAPALILRMDIPREIYAQGRTSLRYSLVVLLVVGVGFGLVTQALLERLVLTRSARQASEERLRETEIKYRTLAEQIPGVIYAANLEDANDTFYISPQIEPLLGFSASEWMSDAELRTKQIHPDDRERVLAQIARSQATGEPFSAEYRLLARDGRVVWVHNEATALKDETGQPYTLQGVMLDVTERKQRERELEAIAAASTALRAALTRTEMLPIILDQLLDLLKAEGAALALHDPTTGEIVIELARGVWAQNTGARLPPDEVNNVRVIADGQPYVNNDVQDDLLLAQPNLVNGLHAVAGVPLIAHQQIIGALWIGRGRTGGSALYSDITADELRLLSALGDMAANAIHRVTLHEQTYHRAEQLAAINALGRALAETLDLPHIYEQLYEATMQLLPDSAGVIIAAFDPDRQQITGAFAVLEGRRLDVNELPPIPLEPPGVGTQSEAIHTRRPFIVNDLKTRLKRVKTHVVLGDEARRTQSGLYVPLLAKGVVTGVMQVQSYALNRYSESDAELLGLAANTAAVAIENARLFAETERRLQYVQALHANDRAITASLDLRLTLNVLLEQVATQLGVDAAAVLLLHAPTQTLEYAAGRGFRTPGIQRTRRRLGEGLAGRAALEKRVLSVPDIQQTPEPFERATLMTGELFTAYFAAPLVAKGQVKGVLEMFHRRPLTPDAEWLDFLDAVAGQAAIAIDNATLFKDLQRSNTDLALAYDTTLEGWTRALDLRDKETEGHTQRVTEMTARLARTMGIGEAALVHLRRGALLHDIGKMGIPDHILLKPGPLTADEWAIMRQHPVYAHDMLAPIAFLRLALDIPYCHHERWDGTGYPRGLKGEAIPLAARIFAVVDVWDALRSDRPYRKGWLEDKVRGHIRAGAGTHFDPEVVEVFLRVVNEPG